MQFTKKDAELRLERLARLKPLPKGFKWSLSICDPGDGRRYQYNIIDESNYGEKASFPRYGHYKPKDFQNYLIGFFDALEDLPWSLNRLKD